MESPRRASHHYNLRTRNAKAKHALLGVNPPKPADVVTTNSKINIGKVAKPRIAYSIRNSKKVNRDSAPTVGPILNALDAGPSTTTPQPLICSGRSNAAEEGMNRGPALITAIREETPHATLVPPTPEVDLYTSNPFNQAMDLDDMPPPPASATELIPSAPTLDGTRAGDSLPTPVAARDAIADGLLSHVAERRDYGTYAYLVSDIACMGGMSESEIIDSACYALVSFPATVGTLKWLLLMLSSNRPNLDLQILAAILAGTDLITKFVKNVATGELAEDQSVEEIEPGYEVMYSYSAETDLMTGNYERHEVINFIGDHMRRLVQVPF